MREDDRISALPDSVLLHILSLLCPDAFYTSAEIIRTCVLSKRWQYLWTSVPILYFNETESEKHDFISSVNGTLILRGHNKLKQFHVSTFNYSAAYQPYFNVWIRYAVLCDVEELVITTHDNDYEVFKLPVHLFRNSCLTKLHLYFCLTEPIGDINWKNIKSLYIGDERITQNLVNNILYGSPSLECLTLSGCEGSGFDVLNFTSTSLRKLVIGGYNGNQDHSKILKIRAPNILSLEITEGISIVKVIWVDAPLLVEANLDFYVNPIGESERIAACETGEEMLKTLIMSLQHVNELKLGEVCLEVLSRLKAKGFTCPLTRTSMLHHDCWKTYIWERLSSLEKTQV